MNDSTGVHPGSKCIPNQPNTHTQNAWVHSFQCSTRTRAQSASLRTAPKLVNSVSAPPMIPTQVNTSYFKPFVSNAAADGSTAGLANCATTAALINSLASRFSVCISPNGNGISAYATSGVFTGISFPSFLAAPASARTQSDLMLFGVQIDITALADTNCFMISSR